jgi:hypothetical protein
VTSLQKTRIRNWIITPAAAFTALTWGWSLVDARFVHQAVFDKRVIADSLEQLQRRREDSVWKERMLQKVDSSNLRLQQIQCGERITRGCR